MRDPKLNGLYLRTSTLPRQHTWLFLITCLAGILFAPPASATIDSGQIIPGSVSATVGTTFDPVNGVSVTFQWQTINPGNSIVIIENPFDYYANNNEPTRQIVQNDFTTNHVVVVDHFPAYSQYGTWGYYVASNVNFTRCTARSAVCHVLATYPGPATLGCGSPPSYGCGGYYLTFTMPTMPTNPNGQLVFTMWPIGGQNVYQGDPTQSPACSPTSKNSRECNDLYVALQPNLLSGPPSDVVQMQNATITNLDTGQIVTDNSVTAQYLCDLLAPSNPPPSNWDGDYYPNNTCYNGTLYSNNSTARLRVNSQAVPGHYQFTANFQAQDLNGNNQGNPVNLAYNFTVLPTASFTATPPANFPPIPGLSTWQTNMVNPTPNYASGEYWCTNNNDVDPWFSLDNGNFSGYFDLPSGIYFEAWNYDGGRVYQQIADYDYYVQGMPGYLQDSVREHWKRCAELAMEPYKDMTIGTQAGFVVEPNQFPYGMAMNYMRTGDATNQTAVDLLAHNPLWNLYFSGSAYAQSARVTAYLMDNRLADEMLGQPRDPAFLLRTVDMLLGYLDQSYNLSLSNPNQQHYDIHPFILGLDMETLITYYQLDVAEGNTPDARIPLEIKKVLDWLEATQYVPATHAFEYQPYDLPKDPRLGDYGETSLNDLVAPAYAWYWYMSGNNTYLTEGDDLFANNFNDGGSGLAGYGGWSWSVKEFNQVYKWSFDYVRWRSGQNPDGSQPPVASVLPAANPCENNTSPCNAPWTDYTAPVQFEWWPGNGNGIPMIYPTTIPAPVVTATTAYFWINVFKPNTSLTVYYGTSAPGTCDIWDPLPPNCMQPFPNFGFLQMLTANYPYQSQTIVGVQDQTALSMGITNIYDESLTITGLQPGTTYHFRPLMTDQNGNMTAFYDQTFTTAAQ